MRTIMWTIRRATLADTPALRALCAAAVGEDDYVPSFLERFIRDSVTFLAEDAGAAIGMMVYDDTPDGGGWLHAARTHPDRRRQGVSRALNRACEDLARSRGRTCLRLWAEARNTASVTASRREGFEERARFTRMRAPASTRPAPDLEAVRLDRMWDPIQGSPLFRHAAGYVFHDFYFLRLTRHVAESLAAQGALLRFGDNVVSVSEDFEESWGRDLQVQLLAGDAAAVLAAAPAVAHARGADRVESFLPHDPDLLDAARRAGFEFMDWGREAVLFEKPLVPPLA